MQLGTPRRTIGRDFGARDGCDLLTGYTDGSLNAVHRLATPMPSCSSFVPERSRRRLFGSLLAACFCGASCSDDRAQRTAEPASMQARRFPLQTPPVPALPELTPGAADLDACRTRVVIPHASIATSLRANACATTAARARAPASVARELRACQKDSAGCLDWSLSSCASRFCADGAICGNRSMECSPPAVSAPGIAPGVRSRRARLLRLERAGSLSGCRLREQRAVWLSRRRNRERPERQG